MPSVSKKQRNFMAAAAHNPAFAKKAGIPVSVAKEFNQADKGKKFGGGGMATKDMKKLFKGKETYAEELKEAKAIKSGKITPKEYAQGEEMEKKMKKGGCCKMAKGGVAKTVTKEMEYDYKTGKKSFKGSTAKRDAHAEKEGKIVAKHAAYDKAKGYAKGGVTRADGCVKKGHTKGKFV